jgi:hypothetical protein
VISTRGFVSVAFALAALTVVGGGMGCGGAGGRNAGAPLPKADVVDVTYYYLPG